MLKTTDSIIFDDLPAETKIHIFSFLKPKDLLIASLVSKSWKDVSCCDYLWKSVVKAILPSDVNSQWKSSYIDFNRLKKGRLATQKKRTSDAAHRAIKWFFNFLAASYALSLAYRETTGQRREWLVQFKSQDVLAVIALIFILWNKIEGLL